MSRFVFWKGIADAVTGVILLTKPEVIYHSGLNRELSRLSGLRTANPHPSNTDAISAQTSLALMVIAVGVAHISASRSRAALPAMSMPGCLSYHSGVTIAKSVHSSNERHLGRACVGYRRFRACSSH